MKWQSEQLILVVDDEPLVRQIAQLMLESVGFTVVVAEDARRALQMLETRPAVCLILSDVQMPGSLDGLDLIKQLRLEGVQTPAVLTSGRVHPQVLPDATTFLPKPYTLAKLLKAVYDHLPEKDSQL